MDKIFEMIAYEAFIRRAAEMGLPFMLKGSYVTRQYFSKPNDRIPGDLDWVYLESLKNEDDARKVFNDWAASVTEFEHNDGVLFRSFKENAFWRRIDYAMADDFPTINTDLLCFIDGKNQDLHLDISFNLDVEQPPIPLLYKPLRGESFTIPYTVPLSLQVSWKIHQTLVRPRFKDLFDLVHLLKHPSFDKITLVHTIQALVNECNADKVDLNKFGLFLSNKIEQLFPNDSIQDNWNLWRHNISTLNCTFYERAEWITDVAKLPPNLSVFLKELNSALMNAGLNVGLMDKLPKPTRHRT
jgi:hypothetical protein